MEPEDRIEELEDIISEAYIVLGCLMTIFDLEDDKLIKMLDNLTACKKIHDDIIPFSLKE